MQLWAASCAWVKFSWVPSPWRGGPWVYPCRFFWNSTLKSLKKNLFEGQSYRKIEDSEIFCLLVHPLNSFNSWGWAKGRSHELHQGLPHGPSSPSTWATLSCFPRQELDAKWSICDSNQFPYGMLAIAGNCLTHYTTTLAPELKLHLVECSTH